MPKPRKSNFREMEKEEQNHGIIQINKNSVLSTENKSQKIPKFRFWFRHCHLKLIFYLFLKYFFLVPLNKINFTSLNN